MSTIRFYSHKLLDRMYIRRLRASLGRFLRFSSRKSPDESYAECAYRKEGLYAKINGIIPGNQMKAERTADLTLDLVLL